MIPQKVRHILKPECDSRRASLSIICPAKVKEVASLICIHFCVMWEPTRAAAAGTLDMSYWPHKCKYVCDHSHLFSHQARFLIRDLSHFNFGVPFSSPVAIWLTCLNAFMGPLARTSPSLRRVCKENSLAARSSPCAHI
jgi:hypothetical protein